MLAFFVATAAASTFAEVPSLESLIDRSASMVEGTVEHAQTRPCSLGLCTTYLITVTSAWKGKVPKGHDAPPALDPARGVRITLPGGRSGGLTQRVAGLPLWRTGDEVVVFLDENGHANWTGVFTVVYGPTQDGLRELADPVNRRDLTSVQSLRSQVRNCDFIEL